MTGSQEWCPSQSDSWCVKFPPRRGVGGRRKLKVTKVEMESERKNTGSGRDFPNETVHIAGFFCRGVCPRQSNWCSATTDYSGCAGSGALSSWSLLTVGLSDIDLFALDNVRARSLKSLVVLHRTDEARYLLGRHTNTFGVVLSQHSAFP